MVTFDTLGPIQIPIEPGSLAPAISFLVNVMELLLGVEGNPLEVVIRIPVPVPNKVILLSVKVLLLVRHPLNKIMIINLITLPENR